MKSKLPFLFLACGAIAMSPTPLIGQDAAKPAAPDIAKNDVPPQRDPQERRRPASDDADVLAPFIGVVTRELEPEVRAQAGLQEGYGLLVVEIMPEGPAKSAGLQQHDVLVRLNDQKLVNVEQLQVLVRSQKKGDDITLTIRRAGAEQDVKIKVGEKKMPPVQRDGRDRSLGFPLPRGGNFRYEPPAGPAGDEWRERAEKFQNQMREYQHRMQEWSADQKGRMPAPPQFGGPGMPRRDGEAHRGPPRPGDGGRTDPADQPMPQTKLSAESRTQVETRGGGGASVTMHGNVIRTDDTGVYTIHRDNDKATFTVRTKDGKETTWPINTAEERQAVPQEFAKVLREMDKIQLDSHDTGGRRRELQPLPPASPGGSR